MPVRGAGSGGKHEQFPAHDPSAPTSISAWWPAASFPDETGTPEGHPLRHAGLLAPQGGPHQAIPAWHPPYVPAAGFEPLGPLDVVIAPGPTCGGLSDRAGSSVNFI